MGIFFNNYNKERRRISFNEIEVSRSQTPQQPEDDEDQQNPPADTDNPVDAPEDYTVPDEGEDQAPEEADQNPPDEGTEATGGDPVADEQYGDEGGGGAAGGEGGEETEDYTEEDMEGDDAGGEDAGGGEDYADDEGIPDDEVKQLEDEIFSNYSAEQIAIMNSELKKDFNKLFMMLDDLVDHINDIPKITEHIRIIEFVSNKLSGLRDMVSDYLYKTYNTKSYTENKIAYNRFLTVVNQINAIISKIPSLKDPKQKT